MKAIILTALCVLGSAAFAAGVTSDARHTNYDGSVSYTNPRVQVNGSMMRVAIGAFGERGVCKLLGKSYVSNTQDMTNGNEAVAAIDWTGGLLWTLNPGVKYYVVGTVICK